MSADVTVVIVNWNAAEVLPACLDSLARQRHDGQVSVIVVDNASTDGSLTLLHRYADHVTVVPAGANLGFGKGNNLGFGHVATPLCVFLNPDTELLGTDVLARLTSVLEDRSVGLAGPRLVNADGTVQGSCARVPSIPALLLLTFGLHRLLPDALRRRWAPVAWSHDRSTDTGWVNGACMAMRSADFAAVGGFSEATFMYGEDLALCYEVHRAGLRVRYVHEAAVLHLRDHSSSQRWSDPQTAARVAAGDVAFLRRRYGRIRLRVALAVLYIGYAGRAAVLGRLGRRGRAALYTAMARAVRTADTR